MAVDSGYWTLLRYNPALAAEGKAPLILDSKKPTIPVAEYIYTENRYKQLTRNNPEVAKKLYDDIQKATKRRRLLLSSLRSAEHSTSISSYMR